MDTTNKKKENKISRWGVTEKNSPPPTLSNDKMVKAQKKRKAFHKWPARRIFKQEETKSVFRPPWSVYVNC